MRDFLHTPCLHPACAVRYAENSSPALHTSGTSDNCDGTDRRTLYMSRMCSYCFAFIGVGYSMLRLVWLFYIYAVRCRFTFLPRTARPGPARDCTVRCIAW